MRQFRYRGFHGWAAVTLLLVTIIIALVQQPDLRQQLSTNLQASQPGLYRVTRFVDGDTFEIDMNGHDEKVRLLGVDTPETHKPNTPVQCYGPAAAAYTKQLIGSQHLRLQSDPLSTDRDRYNRLLRYAYLPDGRLINEELIKNGYGFYYPYFPFSKSQQFAADQAAAQAAHKGLWGNCHPKPTDAGGYVSNAAG